MTILRRTLELATGWMRFKRRLPARFGGNPVFVSPKASLGYLIKPLVKMDAALLSLAENHVRKGMVVWDIGANVGVFSFAAAHLAGKDGLVVSIEPDPLMCQLLNRSATVQARDSAPTNVICMAISDRIGIRQFNIAKRSRAANYLEGFGSTQTGGISMSSRALTFNLDFLASHLPPPDILKIDVEGAELLVLQGASSILREKRPVLICEVSSEVAEEVTQLLRDCDYLLFDGDNPGGDQIKVAAWSTLGIPAERVAACA